RAIAPSCARTAARRQWSRFPFPQKWPLLPGSEGYLDALPDRSLGRVPRRSARSTCINCVAGTLGGARDRTTGGGGGIGDRCRAGTALPQPYRAEDDRSRRAARALPAGSEGGLDDRRLASRRGRRPSVRPLRALHAPRCLDVADDPRHEPVGERISARRLRGRGARADPDRGRLVPVLRCPGPRLAPLVGLAVEAPPPRAALLRDVR